MTPKQVSSLLQMPSSSSSKSITNPRFLQNRGRIPRRIRREAGPWPRRGSCTQPGLGTLHFGRPNRRRWPTPPRCRRWRQNRSHGVNGYKHKSGSLSVAKALKLHARGAKHPPLRPRRTPRRRRSTNRIQLVAVAIAVSFHGRATAFVHRTRAMNHIVAHSVSVGVRAHFRITGTATFSWASKTLPLHTPHSVHSSDTAFVVLPHTWIHVVAHTIPVLVDACASAHPAFIRVQATAIVHQAQSQHARTVVVKHTALR